MINKEDKQSKIAIRFPALVQKGWLLKNGENVKDFVVKELKSMEDVTLKFSLVQSNGTELLEEPMITNNRLIVCQFDPIKYQSDREWIVYFADMCYKWLCFAVENVTHKPLYEMLKKKTEYMKILLHEEITQKKDTTNRRIVSTVDTNHYAHKNYPYYIHRLKIKNQEAHIIVFENECVGYFDTIRSAIDYLNKYLVRDIWRPTNMDQTIKKPLNQQDIFVAEMVNGSISSSQKSIKEQVSIDSSVDDDTDDEEDQDEEDESDDQNKINDSDDDDDEQSYIGSDIESIDRENIPTNATDLIEDVFHNYVQKKNKQQRSYIRNNPDDFVRNAKRGNIDWNDEKDRNEVMRYIEKGNNDKYSEGKLDAKKFNKIMKNVKQNYKNDLNNNESVYRSQMFNNYVKTNEL